ncbi:MAG: ribonuclease HII [Candidatus Omnitrophica bacterium]|nr:ribonuclease HII [Candidatus Omnitrophota bacterium]
MEITHSDAFTSFKLLIGIDEAGRGPLAGPVVAAAVAVLDYSFKSKIADSKTITAKQREQAFLEIFEKGYVGLGIINEAVIDQVNILEATYVAMATAVRQLLTKIPGEMLSEIDAPQKICMLVDGNRFKSDLPYVCKTIVGGDRKSFSIACASIIAKVTRDRILATYDKVFPQYGFKKHKGYPTAEHRKAIKTFGPSLIHRKSFQMQTV